MKWIALCLALLTCLFPHLVEAQQPTPRKRLSGLLKAASQAALKKQNLLSLRLLTQAKTLAETQLSSKTLPAKDRAYYRGRLSVVHYAMGLVFAETGQSAFAVRSLFRALRFGPAKKLRRRIDARMKSLQNTSSAHVRIDTSVANAQVVLSAQGIKVVGKAPFASWVPVGVVNVVISHSGYQRFVAKLTVTPGQTVQRFYPLVKRVLKPRPRPRLRPKTRVIPAKRIIKSRPRPRVIAKRKVVPTPKAKPKVRVGAWVVLAVGVAAGIAGGVLTGMGKVEFDRVYGKPEHASTWATEGFVEAQNAQSLQTVGVVVLGVGGACAVAGIVWLAWPDK
jgi:hypothetical protein